MAGSTLSTEQLAALQNAATHLRIESVRSTSTAGSGHPSSCCSAADIVAALFFSIMRYDPKNPKAFNSDRFVLSKGHAAPLLYAAWAEAGLFPKQDLLKLRTLTSDLEGHPTPRLPFVDMATGSPIDHHHNDHDDQSRRLDDPTADHASDSHMYLRNA